MFEEWGLAGAAVALTLGLGRPLGTLGLRAPHGWIFAVATCVTIAYAILVMVQARQLAGSPGAQDRLRKRLEPLRGLIPHTLGEFRLFLLLSLTAGVCEELLFRGYLVWVLKTWIGLWGAAIVSMVVFGLGHAYQGAKHGVRAFLAGVALGLLALATGSILPGIVLHALIDMGSGWVTYIAMRNGDADEPRSQAGAA
jgi:membrane protease YdiL (CAAX protease family)